MRPLPISDILLTDRFWSRWRHVLVETTLPAEYKQLVDTDRIRNFERVTAGEQGGFEGFWFNDSDVYKWLEACAYALVHQPNPDLRQKVEEVVEKIASAQMSDGYVNTFFQLNHPDLKWRNLNMMHEMYCGGHLIEAGVAMAQNLGDNRLLEVSRKFADHVMSIFGPDKRRGYCGHEEIELALIRLAELTGEGKYRDFARWMVEERGKRPSPFQEEVDDEGAMKLFPHTGHLLDKGGEYSGEYAQDHAPIREHTSVVGHAVRAMYYYIAAADLADGLQDSRLEDALVRTWNSLTKKRMYVTGGIGPSASNEGFTTDYDLPNLSAYAETCAAIGLALWGNQMLQVTGDATYADVVERAIFNGALSGISLSGDKFFYTNPLESRGSHDRVPWFSCACCPPNIARMIGRASDFVLGASEDELFLNIPAGLEATLSLNGVETKIRVESDYPWSGQFKVFVDPSEPVAFGLYVRIPDWSSDVSAELPDADEEAEYENGYMVFRRQWKKGDVLTVDLEMAPKWIESNPLVRENLGRVALTNGPLIYCAERTDLGYAPQLLVLDTDGESVVEKSNLLDGVNTISVEGTVDVETFVDDLYAEVGTTEVQEAHPKLIPYFAWNNRGATDMQVWLRRM